MKTRIIAMLLLVVMLVSALASCGYSYMKEDYSKYVTFTKAELDAILENIEIEDGDFTADEATREKRVWDAIYETLAGKVDKEDKVTEGAAGEHDILYYCYYATVKNDNGDTVVVLASKMQESSATKFQLGLSDTEGVAAKIEENLGEFNFTEDAYKTLTSGKAAADKVAYITYTVEETVDGTDKPKTTYTYERVTIGDANHPVAKRLADYDIATTYKETVDGTDKTTFVEGNKTYSNVKINWVVESGECISFTDTTYTTATSEKSVDGTATALKDKELTYYVYPVYYNEVAEYSAAELLKTVFTSITVDTLPSFEGKEDAIKALTDLKTALTDAQAKTADAEETVETAKTALEKAESAVTGETPTEAQQITIDAAKEALTEAEDTLSKAQADEATAEAALDAGITEFYNTVSAETIENDYKQSVFDSLLASYNTEIKNNLAKVIWNKMLELTEVSHPSNEAIKPVYDRLMDNHRYNFSTGTYDSTNKISNYKQFGGDFDKYLKYVTGVGDADVIKAKDKVWTEAEAYVSDIFVVFAVAEAYGQMLTDEDMKAFREDENSSYSYYEYYYGEDNVQVAVQFDKFMNHVLEWETEGEGDDETAKYVEGKIKFVRVNYTLKED